MSIIKKDEADRVTYTIPGGDEGKPCTVSIFKDDSALHVLAVYPWPVQKASDWKTYIAAAETGLLVEEAP